MDYCDFYLYDKKNKVERQCRFKINIKNTTENGITLHFCTKHNKEIKEINVGKNKNKNMTTNEPIEEQKSIFLIKKILLPFLHKNEFINNPYKISFLKLLDKLYPEYINEEETFIKSIHLYEKFIQNNIDILTLYNKIIFFNVSICVCYKFYESEDTDFKKDKISKFHFNYNKIFSKHCNISVQVFNEYEIEFLKKIDYNIYKLD
jgi:hypothetical protein